MATVVADMSMSLDGFIADPNDWHPVLRQPSRHADLAGRPRVTQGLRVTHLQYRVRRSST